MPPKKAQKEPRKSKAAKAAASSSAAGAAAAPRAQRAIGAGSGTGKTVSKATLKRDAHQAMSLQPLARMVSPKAAAGADVHSGLTPHLEALRASGDGPSEFSLSSEPLFSPSATTPAARTRSHAKPGAGKGGKGKPVSASEKTLAAAGTRRVAEDAPAAAYLHVGAGGTGKRYTGVSAMTAAKKAWRDCKHLPDITMRAVSGGEETTFKASDWTASAEGVGAKKFGDSGPRSHRDKAASYRKL